MIRLVLVGGGHSHLEILRRQILTPRRDLSLTLVSQFDRQHYSGMVPGFLAGLYSEPQISFELSPLVTRAAGVFTRARVAGLRPGSRHVLLEHGEPIPYDLVSFGIGSGVSGSDTPGVREHAFSVKPIGQAVAVKAALETLAVRARGNGSPARVTVVGAGAAGFEIACAAEAVLSGAAVLSGTAAQVVQLVDGGDQLLAGTPEPVRRLALKALRSKSIGLRLGSRVTAVSASGVVLATGETLPSDLTIWTTGPAAPEVFRDSGLALDPSGFLLVNDALRSISDPAVLGAGDCVSLESHPETPKAGVYAVREAPILWESITAALDGMPPPRYRPQSGFLSLLSTADRRAVLHYGPVALWSSLSFRLKDAIDRRFVRRYQRLI
ncbi:MAG: FAD-dependent oxidoreductase [Thermoanaerobaculia bacterium]